MWQNLKKRPRNYLLFQQAKGIIYVEEPQMIKWLLAGKVKFVEENIDGKIRQVMVTADGKNIGVSKEFKDHGYQFNDTSYLEKNYLLILKNGQGSRFVSNAYVQDPRNYDALYTEADQILRLNPNGTTKAEVYLNKDPQLRRIEVKQAGGTSLIFDFSTFKSVKESTPIAKTVSSTDANGLLHIVTTDLLPANYGVQVEDVFQPLFNAKPVKLYSDRFLQKERIYFKDGHEEYSVSLDTKFEPGQTVLIDGTEVEHVTGLFTYDEKTNSGYHVSLREMQKTGWFAPIRFTTFEDGQFKVDQTGFVKLQPGLTAEQIMDRVRKSGVLNLTDVYTYKTDGSLDHRTVSFLSNGSWHEGWT